MNAYRTAYHRARVVGTAPLARLHTRRARLPAFLFAFLMAALLPARFGALWIAFVIRGTIEAAKVLALERTLAGVTFVMRAARRKCARIRVCIFTRKLLAVVASRFTRPAAARHDTSAKFLAFEIGGVSATSHDAAVFAAW